MVTINEHIVSNPKVTYQLPKFIAVEFDTEETTYDALETQFFGDIVVANDYGSEKYYPKAIVAIGLANGRAKMTFQLTVGETEADVLRNDLDALTETQTTDAKALNDGLVEVEMAVAEVYELLVGGGDDNGGSTDG